MKMLLIVIVIIVLGWDFAWWAAGVRPIGPGRLKEMMKSTGKRPILLDVRMPAEYGFFHIESAENRPDLLHSPEARNPLDKNSPIVVICLSGHRSPIAAYLLRKQGFRDVSYLSWGMISWVISGGPTVKGR